MLRSETGKVNEIRNVIGTPSHPLHSLKMISLVYSNDGIFNFDITTSAENVMKDFLLSPQQDEKQKNRMLS